VLRTTTDANESARTCTRLRSSPGPQRFGGQPCPDPIAVLMSGPGGQEGQESYEIVVCVCGSETKATMISYSLLASIGLEM
jgi:hypothetical protein